MPISIFLVKSKKYAVYKFLVALGAGDAQALAVKIMNTLRLLLFIDAVINLVLGCLLVTFPGSVVSALGVPGAESAFYPSILGAVLLGIGIALLIEIVKGRGLGLMTIHSFLSLDLRLLPERCQE